MIHTGYERKIEELVRFLRRHEWYVTALILGALLEEPWQAIKAAFLWPASWKKHFNFYGMNPHRPQLDKRPILLIHGNYHNQSAWLKLAKHLQKSDLFNLYTVNLPNGFVTANDFEIIVKKIEEIKGQYDRGTEIDLIGHSRGGKIARQLDFPALQKNGHIDLTGVIGKVITIGSPLTQEDLDRLQGADFSNIFEIFGTHDILVTNRSLLPPSQQKEINTGHLELLFSAETHQTIMHWLSFSCE